MNIAARTRGRQGGSATALPLPPALPEAAVERFRAWFAGRGWEVFPFQEEVWQAAAAGESGLLHAPTGTGKTLAAWLGAVARSAAVGADPAARRGPLVVWITPLKALAADTALALEEPLRGTGRVAGGLTVAVRTGDSSAADRRRLRAQWPTALVTTPESLSILLSLEDAHEIFADLQTVVVDEWHELLSTKRGVQTELALARLRALRPGLATWGLSATLANLDDARAALIGPAAAPAARL
ncbi:MAG: DEAD/DEAH box helicase, partial [Planctomycetia bacterium]